jgi:hypothetical protein
VEVGVRADQPGVSWKFAAALAEQVLELFECLDAPVGDGLVDEGPQVLGGLKLGRVRRQEHQVDPFGSTTTGSPRSLAAPP